MPSRSCSDHSAPRAEALRRRGFLTALAAGGVILGMPRPGGARPLPTTAHIVILGAGAAGVSMASQLARRLDGATLTLIDPRPQHLFQPGYTLIGAGIWTPDDVRFGNEAYIPDGTRWYREAAAEIDLDGKVVTTDTGRLVPYDHLVVATGLELNYGGIAGMDPHLIGQDGIVSIYASPEAALASFHALEAFIETGGDALFVRPATEMKCAGAPLKVTFIAEDLLRLRGRREAASLTYLTPFDNLFSVRPVHNRVAGLFADRSVGVAYHRTLMSIDPARRIATFEDPAGQVEERPYDLIHVVPPMRAPAVIRNSPLPWQDGPLAADGWVEVDPTTLQHRCHPEVFAVGDVAGVPKGKTAASVKWQVPVAAANLVSMIAGRDPAETYNGYTSCPMITGYGRAMLVEFDYDGNLTPSFPFIDPLAELWTSWIIEEHALKPAYQAMLRGHG